MGICAKGVVIPFQASHWSFIQLSRTCEVELVFIFYSCVRISPVTFFWMYCVYGKWSP